MRTPPWALFFGLACTLACGSGSGDKKVESDTIVGSWSRLQGAWWLLPNLREARVVLPDRPHSRAEVEESHRGEGGLQRVREYRLSTNSRRLRGPEIGDKKPGTLRIAALGDSVTHGWGVSQSEAYPAQLQAILADRGRPAEVLNAGVPANRLDTMERWCRVEARDLEVDWILWTRRPDPRDGEMAIQRYKQHLLACKQASQAEVLAVLPPVSSFDLKGMAAYRAEASELRRVLEPGVGVLELTDAFRVAQEGRGERLEVDGERFRVRDLNNGTVWLEGKVSLSASGPLATALEPSIYALFEQHPEVREALFFDEGHPDSEGFAVFAEQVADKLESIWAQGASR